MKPGSYFKDQHRLSYIEVEDESDGTVMGRLFTRYRNKDGEIVCRSIDDVPKMYITNMHEWEPLDDNLLRRWGNNPFAYHTVSYGREYQGDAKMCKSTYTPDIRPRKL